MPREFAVVRNGKVVGLFDTANDAQTAMQSLIAPQPPGKLEVVSIGMDDRKSNDPRGDRQPVASFRRARF